MVLHNVFGRAVARTQKFVVPALSVAAVVALAGCGAETGYLVGPAGPGPGQTGSYTGVAFSVTVKAGKVPLASAEVQLYAAGTTGNGTGASSLLTQTVATAANGIASIPAGYTCPASNSMVYLVSKGGVIGAGSANSSSWLMTAIGPCNSLISGQTLVIDEVTTVAAAYSLAPFYVTGGAVGASATNTIGLKNAFATAATLGDPVAGTSPGSTLPSNAVSPAPRVNSLANMVNACVVFAPACGGLFAAASTGGVPLNTLDAMVKLAQNPTANVATLYSIAGSSNAYAPALTKQPADWCMFINFGGGGMSSPTGMGVDSQGNVWVSSYVSAASKFSSIGAPIFANGITGSGLLHSYGLAVDLSDNAWIPNEDPYYGAYENGSVTELNSSGISLAGATGYTGSGLYYPTSVAIDPNGTVWVTDNGDARVTLLTSSGMPLSGATGYLSTMFAFPVTVVVDANHYGWVGNLGSNQVSKVSPDGTSITDYTAGYGSSGLAIDQGNNVWTANFYDSTVSLLKNSGTAVGTFTGGGSIDVPQGIAVDGAGNIWVANYRAKYLTELSASTSATPGAPLTPAAGVGSDAALLEAYALVIDASGNLWVTNYGTNTLTKFVGMASPVKTPLSGVPKAP